MFNILSQKVLKTYKSQAQGHLNTLLNLKVESNLNSNSYLCDILEVHIRHPIFL